MRRVVGIALLLLLPAGLRAADAPEALLPGSTQLYLRWDGLAPHRAAYAKTALGQTLAGDTGTFLAGLFTQVQETLGGELVVGQLLSGRPPEELQKAHTQMAEAVKALPELLEHGLLVAGEFASFDPPRGRGFVVFPDSKPGPLFAAVQLTTGLAKLPVKESKVGSRTVFRAESKPVHFAWWTEGGHAVFYFGTDNPDAVLRDLSDAARPKLAAAPLFRRVADFHAFETDVRAFVDVPALAKLAAGDEKVGKILTTLGVSTAGELVYYSGFDGAAGRGRFEWTVPGPRTGLFKLLQGTPLRGADLPPMPPNVLAWSVTSVNAVALFDVGLQAVEQIAAVVDPGELENIRSFQTLVRTTLGVDLRNDLLATLGDRVVVYAAPSEGPLVLGQTVLIRVKDGQKLQSSLDQAVKSLLKLTGNDATVRKRTYHGVAVREVQVRTQGFIFVPTYTIHNGWLAISLFPQAIQGYIGRSSGQLERWQPPDSLRATLDTLPKGTVAVSYADPRPVLRFALAFAPMIAGSIKSFVPGSTFEVDSIPNAQEATRFLFPNVAVTADDGKVLRRESRNSLWLPVDGAGLDSFGVFFLFGLADLF